MINIMNSVLLTFIVFTGQHNTQAAADSAPAEIYAQLEEAMSRTREIGFSVSDSKQLRELRQKIVEQGDSGALFVLQKLGSFNSAEAKAAPSGDCADALGSSVALQNAPIKMELFLTLAESYPYLSPQIQTEVLQTLVDSYTLPVACDTHGGRSVLGWSLIRIGKPSVDGMLQLATSPYESVRCGVDEMLNSIANSLSSSHEAVSLPPRLTCKAPRPRRTDQLHQWSTWWHKNSPRITFPTLPEPELGLIG